MDVLENPITPIITFLNEQYYFCSWKNIQGKKQKSTDKR